MRRNPVDLDEYLTDRVRVFAFEPAGIPMVDTVIVPAFKSLGNVVGGRYKPASMDPKDYRLLFEAEGINANYLAQRKVAEIDAGRRSRIPYLFHYGMDHGLKKLNAAAWGITPAKAGPMWGIEGTGWGLRGDVRRFDVVRPRESFKLASRVPFLVCGLCPGIFDPDALDGKFRLQEAMKGVLGRTKQEVMNMAVETINMLTLMDPALFANTDKTLSPINLDVVAASVRAFRGEL